MPIKKARFKINEYNQTRKRKVNKHERRIRMVSLSLTSMVDMFAILVVFLLSDTSTVIQRIELGHGIQLPKAKDSTPPTEAATLQISSEGVFENQKLILGISQIQQGQLSPIRDWLSEQEKKDGYINIVAHDKLPFGIIRKVISMCQEQGFGNVNLAVQPKT